MMLFAITFSKCLKGENGEMRSGQEKLFKKIFKKIKSKHTFGILSVIPSGFPAWALLESSFDIFAQQDAQRKAAVTSSLEGFCRIVWSQDSALSMSRHGVKVKCSKEKEVEDLLNAEFCW